MGASGVDHHQGSGTLGLFLYLVIRVINYLDSGLTHRFFFLGAPPADSRNCLDARALGLAVLEPQCLCQWPHPRQQDSQMVV